MTFLVQWKNAAFRVLLKDCVGISEKYVVKFSCYPNFREQFVEACIFSVFLFFFIFFLFLFNVNLGTYICRITWLQTHVEEIGIIPYNILIKLSAHVQMNVAISFVRLVKKKKKKTQNKLNTSICWETHVTIVSKTQQ